MAEEIAGILLDKGSNPKVPEQSRYHFTSLEPVIRYLGYYASNHGLTNLSLDDGEIKISHSWGDWYYSIYPESDTVFYDVDLSKICNSLNKYPLICSGNHLIYICDYTDDGVVVYSAKKDTLDYAGLSTEQILCEIAETLNHEYLVVETNDTEIKHPRPVNLLDMYYSITNESIGFDKLKSKFRGLKDLRNG